MKEQYSEEKTSFQQMVLEQPDIHMQKKEAGTLPIQNLIPNRTSLAVHWLRLCASNAGVTGSIPSWRTKISYATQCGHKKKKKN